jgi:hypothetical protein
MFHKVSVIPQKSMTIASFCLRSTARFSHLVVLSSLLLLFHAAHRTEREELHETPFLVTQTQVLASLFVSLLLLPLHRHCVLY